MSDCRKCAEFSWCLENEDCGLFKQKPQTNADRIRAMTDEELAEWGCTLAGCPPGPDLTELCYPEAYGNRSCCYKCWLGWLKQEAKEDK